MKGKVKWFSVDEGYGFVTNDRGVDHYFRVADVRGVTLPTIGSEVGFDATESSRGPRAKNIRIIALADTESNKQRANDRVTCAHCGRRMVPKLQYWRGSILGSNCPFCLQPHREYQPVPLVNWRRVRKPFKYLAIVFLLLVVIQMVFTVVSSLLGEL